MGSNGGRGGGQGKQKLRRAIRARHDVAQRELTRGVDGVLGGRGRVKEESAGGLGGRCSAQG